MKGQKLVLNIFVMFSIFDLTPVYGVSLDQMQPGVVGYATKQFQQMSEAEKDKYGMFLKCTFMAIRLKYDGDASKYLAHAISSTVPPFWGDWYTETTTYYRGYVDGLFVNNSNKLMAAVYDKTCRPILTISK